MTYFFGARELCEPVDWWRAAKEQALYAFYSNLTCVEGTLYQATWDFFAVFLRIDQLLLFYLTPIDGPFPISSRSLLRCSVGKYRTGVVSMLLLSLAGCSSPTIACEYALNDLNTDWLASSIQRLLAQPGLNGNVDSETSVIRAKSEYMAVAVNMFGRDFGSIDVYCRSHLQLDEVKIAAVKAKIVVGS